MSSRKNVANNNTINTPQKTSSTTIVSQKTAKSEDTSEKQDKNPIQVAGRLFETIEYLADHGSCGLSELAEELSLNKSTMHRVLASLQYMGYVRQNEKNGSYDLTFKLMDISERMRGHIDMISIVRPYLKQLMEECGETVHLVKREGSDCVYIDKVEATQNNIRMVSHIGSRIPFYRSAVGKALAANMTEDEVAKLWAHTKINRTTPYTITNYEDFSDILNEIRRKGYALDNEENETGVRCIGAALDIAENSTEYAFSISLPVGRMDNDRIGELSKLILRTKHDIEQNF